MLSSQLQYLNQKASWVKFHAIIDQEENSGFHMVMLGVVENHLPTFNSTDPKQSSEEYKIRNKLALFMGRVEDTKNFDKRTIKRSLFYLPTEEELNYCNMMGRLPSGKYLCLPHGKQYDNDQQQITNVRIVYVDNKNTWNFDARVPLDIEIEDEVDIDYLIRTIKDCKYFMVKRFLFPEGKVME